MRILLVLLAVVLALVIPGMARATTLNFDDIDTGSAGWIDLATPYQGFVLTGDWEAVSNSYFSSIYGNSYTAPSAANAVYDGFDDGANTATIKSTTGTFDFISAYFSAWTQNNKYQGYSAQTLTITGKKAGNDVGSVTLALGIGYQQYAVNLLGVDEVVFTAPVVGQGVGQYWLMDDLTYQTDPVPEPGTMLLLGTGLVSLGIFGRRKSRAKK